MGYYLFLYVQAKNHLLIQRTIYIVRSYTVLVGKLFGKVLILSAMVFDYNISYFCVDQSYFQFYSELRPPSTFMQSRN